MAQIVIDISNDTYYRCKNEKVGLLPFDVPEVCNAIKNGTALPEGHGNVIDTKELYGYLNKETSDNFVLKVDAIVSRVKPIIEADKEEE